MTTTVTPSLSSHTVCGPTQAIVAIAVTMMIALKLKSIREVDLGDPAHDWRYAAEGALNVACRYVGNETRLHGKVLRLSKANPEALGSAENDLSRWLQGRRFIRDVMAPLLGEEFIPKSRSVRLSLEFINILAEAIEEDRPESRRKHGLDRAAPFGLLMTDLARLDCGCRHASYCFEIKPKWGFLFPRSSSEVKRRVDRFTMHQHLKRKEEGADEKKELSLYSPLELFKGDVESLSMALVRLATTPQNNFRYFLDGKQVFPLASSSSSSSSFWDAEKSASELIRAVADALCGSGVLQRVRRAQMMSESEEHAYDIEHVWPVYEEMVRRGEPVPKLHEGGAPDLGASHRPDAASREGRAEIVRRFLVACTARDCSIMVTVSRCPALLGAFALPRTSDGRWCYRLAVVDLDAKPVEKLRYYYEMDREIVAHYERSVEKGEY